MFVDGTIDFIRIRAEIDLKAFRLTDLQVGIECNFDALAFDFKVVFGCPYVRHVKLRRAGRQRGRHSDLVLRHFYRHRVLCRFGLGTFTGLDGEMVMIGGDCFRATAGGVVEGVDDSREVPFALVTRYSADIEATVEASASLDELTGKIDSMRPSENLFVGMLVDGRFEHLSMRAACRALPGENLVEATNHQSEFDVSDVTGSLVGFWSPTYSRAIGVPGYHFHFISDDRETGGHVLGLKTGRCQIGLHTESDLHLALPGTAEFLAADLSGDHEGELRTVESERHSPTN